MMKRPTSSLGKMRSGLIWQPMSLWNSPSEPHKSQAAKPRGDLVDSHAKRSARQAEAPGYRCFSGRSQSQSPIKFRSGRSSLNFNSSYDLNASLAQHGGDGIER